jgi:hypothetical protein
MAKLLSEKSAASEVLQEAREIYQTHRPEFLESIRKRLEYIIGGDLSLAKFKKHAEDHARSSFGGEPWKVLLADDKELNFLWRMTNRFLREFQNIVNKEDEQVIKFFEEHELRSDLITVAVRSRPGELKTEDVNYVSDTVEIVKHRDRAAGGVPFTSQFMYPLDDIGKKRVYKVIHALYEKILKMKILMPELHGVEVYKKILANPDYTYFDTSNAEKIEIVNEMILEKVGLHESGFPLEAGLSKMSGGFGTRHDGNIGEMCLDKAAIDLNYLIPLGSAEMLAAGDNKAGYFEVSEEIDDIFSIAQRFLGWNIDGQTIHVTSDGILHNENVGHRFRTVEFKLKQLHEFDIAQTLLPTTLFGEDIPTKFLDACKSEDLDIRVFEAGNFVNEVDLEEIPKVRDLWDECKEDILPIYRRLGIIFAPETKFSVVQK